MLTRQTNLTEKSPATKQVTVKPRLVVPWSLKFLLSSMQGELYQDEGIWEAAGSRMWNHNGIKASIQPWRNCWNGFNFQQRLRHKFSVQAYATENTKIWHVTNDVLAAENDVLVNQDVVCYTVWPTDNELTSQCMYPPSARSVLTQASPSVCKAEWTANCQHRDKRHHLLSCHSQDIT